MTSIATAFCALTLEQQTLVLAAYAHDLTIVARESYTVGGTDLSDPQLLRSINEVQHRIASAILSRLSGDEARYPDMVLLNVIGVGEGDDPMSSRFRASFRQAWRIAFGEHFPLVLR
jgi:hypothetical protein